MMRCGRPMSTGGLLDPLRTRAYPAVPWLARSDADQLVDPVEVAEEDPPAGPDLVGERAAAVVVDHRMAHDPGPLLVEHDPRHLPVVHRPYEGGAVAPPAEAAGLAEGDAG